MMISLHLLNNLDSETEKEIVAILQSHGWNPNQINGQIACINILTTSPNIGLVYVAKTNNTTIGFASMQLYDWNKLAQIHGIAIDQHFHRQGIARSLIDKLEDFAQKKDMRGMYVDTPTSNTGARAFYTNIGFKQAYIMPEYYDYGCDGVTYLKLFKNEK